MVMSTREGNRGFTIVELLIVVVIIAILASITLVTYSGIQNRSKDSQTDAAVSQLKKAIEMYRVDESVYPAACSGGDGSGCGVSSLAPFLTPKYLSTMPVSATTLYYVRDTSAVSYGILVDYLSKSDCKTGVDVKANWWGAGVPVC